MQNNFGIEHVRMSLTDNIVFNHSLSVWLHNSVVKSLWSDNLIDVCDVACNLACVSWLLIIDECAWHRYLKVPIYCLVPNCTLGWFWCLLQTTETSCRPMPKRNTDSSNIHVIFIIYIYWYLSVSIADQR